MAAKQKKSSKVGRNKAKCAAYRTRKGSVDGSKRPKIAGSNQTKPMVVGTILPPRKAPKEPTVEVGIQAKETYGFLAEVPASWIR